MKYRKNDILKYTGKYADICRETGYIDPVLYDEYGVKRGLRDKKRKRRFGRTYFNI